MFRVFVALQRLIFLQKRDPYFTITSMVAIRNNEEKVYMRAFSLPSGGVMFVPDELPRKAQQKFIEPVVYNGMIEIEEKITTAERLERLANKIAALKAKSPRFKNAA